MSNVSELVPESDAPVAAERRRPSAGRFGGLTAHKIYIGLSVLIALIAVVGFWPKYFGPLLGGIVDKPTIIHFHAAVFSGWVALFIAQIVFAATGRMRQHRKIGNIGIYYGFALIAVGLFTGFVQSAARVDAGSNGRFMLAPLTDMIMFSIFFGTAIAYRHKPEIHKRCMLVATTALLVAAVGRMDFIGGAFAREIRLLIWISPLLLALSYDLYARRVVHPVYVVGTIA